MYYKSAKYMVCMPHKPLVEFGNSSSYFHFVFLIFSETGINKVSHSKTKSNQRNGKNTFFHQIIALTNFFSTFHLEKNVLTASRVLCNDFSLVGFFFIIEKYIVAT